MRAHITMAWHILTRVFLYVWGVVSRIRVPLVHALGQMWNRFSRIRASFGRKEILIMGVILFLLSGPIVRHFSPEEPIQQVTKPPTPSDGVVSNVGVFFTTIMGLMPWWGWVLLVAGVVLFVYRAKIFSIFRTTPTPPGTPPTPPGTPPPAPPTRSVWGTPVVFGVIGIVVMGVLLALFLLFGKEVRELVPIIPEVPDVPIPQSRGEIIQWIEGIDWRWGDWEWVLPYLAVIPAGVVSHYFSTNTALGYKVWKVTLQTMLYTLLAVLAFQFQDVLVAFFGMLGVSVDGVLVTMLLKVDFKPLYVVTLLGSFLLLWLAFYGLTNKAILYAFGVAALYTLTLSLATTELSNVNGIWALSALAMLGLVINGYVLRASMLAFGTAVLLALIST